MPEPRSPRPTKLLIFVSTEVGTISARRLTGAEEAGAVAGPTTMERMAEADALKQFALWKAS